MGHPLSPVRCWMSHHFPETREALKDLRQSLPDLTGKTIASPRGALTTAGMALDNPIRPLARSRHRSKSSWPGRMPRLTHRVGASGTGVGAGTSLGRSHRTAMSSAGAPSPSF